MERVLGNKVNVSKSGNLSLSVSWRAVNLAFSRILGFADKRFPLYPPLPFPLPFFCCSRSKISRNKVIQATFASPKRYFTETNRWVPLLTAKKPLYVTQLTPLVPSDVVCTFTCLFCVCPPGCHLSLVTKQCRKHGKERDAPCLKTKFVSWGCYRFSVTRQNQPMTTQKIFWRGIEMLLLCETWSVLVFRCRSIDCCSGSLLAPTSGLVLKLTSRKIKTIRLKTVYNLQHIRSCTTLVNNIIVNYFKV